MIIFRIMNLPKLFSLLLLVVLFSACGSFPGMFNKSGTMLTMEAQSLEPNRDVTIEQTIDVLEKRLNALGINGDVAKSSDYNRIEVKIYGDADMEKVKRILSAPSKFELRAVVSPPSPSPMQIYPSKEAALQSIGGKETDSRIVLPYSERDAASAPNQQSIPPSRWIVLENPSIADGRDLKTAAASPSAGETSNYDVQFSLNPTGAQRFGDWTGKNINRYLAIILNDEAKSAAYIKTQIFDQGIIDGRFTRQSAGDLALILNSGYLPSPLKIIEEKKFGN